MREGACGLVCAERALTFALSAGLPGAPAAGRRRGEGRDEREGRKKGLGREEG